MTIKPLYKRLLLALKLLISAGLLWLLLDLGYLDLTILQTAGDHQGMLALVVVLVLFLDVLAAYRWYLLLTVESTTIPFLAVLRVSFLAMFTNIFVPGGLGGDVIRITYAVKQWSIGKTVSVMAVFIERVIVLYAILFVACWSILPKMAIVSASVPLRYLAMMAMGSCLGLPLILYFSYINIRNKSWLKKFMMEPPQRMLPYTLYRLIESIRLYRRAPMRMLKVFMVSILAFVLVISAVAVLGTIWHLGTLQLMDYAFVTPWSFIANQIPITPGGLGVGEAAFDQLCHLIEPTRTMAAYGTLFLVFRLVDIVATLVGLLLSLLGVDRAPDPAF